MNQVRKRVIALLVCAALLGTTLALMQLLGMRGRTSLPEQKRLTVTGEQGVYDAFASSGARGRILVVFDRTSHLQIVSAPTAQASYRAGSLAANAPSSDLVALLIQSGLAREVYVVFPESEWARVSKIMSTQQWSRAQGRAFESRVAGAPVKLTTTPPVLSEKAVVYVNGASADRYSPGIIESITASAASDLVVIQGGGTR